MLLANVEREKELLRVFLKVSQMENKILRRMNLSSFLMVSLSLLNLQKNVVTQGKLIALLHRHCHPSP